MDDRGHVSAEHTVHKMSLDGLPHLAIDCNLVPIFRWFACGGHLLQASSLDSLAPPTSLLAAYATT